MRQREYQFVFFLNISHSFYSDQEESKKHFHTWELEVSMHPLESELVRFREAEQVITEYLESFQDRYLNWIAPFNRVNPSIENFLDYIAGEIAPRMQKNGWEVKEFRISENPTRSYRIDRNGMDKLRETGVVSTEFVKSKPEEPCTEEPKPEESRTEEPKPEKVQEERKEEKPQAEKPKVEQPKKGQPEVKPVTKTLVDTDELRIKLQTVGNQSRIVITVP